MARSATLGWIAIAVTAFVTAIPGSLASPDRDATPLRWPVIAEVNRAYNARAVPEAHGFRLEYRIDGRAVTQRVALPAALWKKMKADFRPRQVGVVVSPSGALSSVGVQERDRELWITFDRAVGPGQCLAMIYPSGRGIGEMDALSTTGACASS